MKEQLIILDGDGTTSRAANPFLEVAKRLGCFDEVSFHAEDYLRQRISYRELIARQNPVFHHYGRLFARENGYESLNRGLFAKVLQSAIGPIEVLPETQRLIDWVKTAGPNLAIISSGWDAITRRTALLAGVSHWESNRILFEHDEFCGTELMISGDKIAACTRLARIMNVNIDLVVYIGDSDFDHPIMDFVRHRGGQVWMRLTAGPQSESLSSLSPSWLMSSSFDEVAGILGFEHAA
jgi:phosphoserine phosphatase